MPLATHIPIRYFIVLALGIGLEFYLNLGLQTGVGLCGISLLVLGSIHYRKKRLRHHTFEVIAAIGLIGIGINAFALRFEKLPANHYSKYPANYNTIQVQVREELRSGSFNNRYIAEIVAVDAKPTTGKILFFTPDSVSLLPDAYVMLTKKWQAIRPPLNPGQFDFRDYMALQGIYDEIRIGSKDPMIEYGSKPSLTGQLRTIRQRAGDLLHKAGLSAATVATTEALVLGQRNHLDRELYDAYKDAGAVHILAVSGLHIGILVLILKFLTNFIRRFRQGKRLQFLIILLLLWAYALFTGMSPSVVRAVTLFSFISYAWMIGRPTNMYNTLALSFFFILLVVQPAHLFQAGFQMSYAAVLAIIWIYPKLMKFWHPRYKFLKWAWQLSAVSLSAQLGVLPISLYYFHQFPGLFFLSNLLILPCLGIVLFLGITMILLTQLGWQIKVLIAGYDLLINSMNALVQWIGNQEVFIFRDVVLDMPQLLLLYGLIVTFVLFLESRRYKTGIALLSIALSFQFWLGYKKWKFRENQSLYVMHNFGSTVLLEQRGAAIDLYSDSPTTTFERSLQDFQHALGKGKVRKYMLQNCYQWDEHQILIVDEAGIIPDSTTVYTHILLIQSPCIHLDRLLSTYPTATIIADGSNYPSFIQRWQQSCDFQKRSFHYTGTDGAYRFAGK